MSCEACLLAFLTSALEFALGARLEIAWPRLTDPLPVIFALSAAKPPGMLKFCNMSGCHAPAEALETVAGSCCILAG